MKKLFSITTYLAIAILVGVTVAYAGSLTPPGSVANTMYTLTDLFNLSAGTTATLGSGAIPTTPGTVAATGKTLTEVYDAIAGEIDNLSNSTIASGVSAFGFTGTLSGPGLPKTGQTDCWDASGNPIACTDGGTALGGQDGYYLEGLPASGARFVDNSNNTITDNATGLMWKKCSEGLSGASCATGSATSTNWTTALSTCEADTTAGHTDWRLPNIMELFSIVSFFNQLVSPAINTTFFPATSGARYWSSTTLTDGENAAYHVDFIEGEVTYTTKSNTATLIRCVR